MLYFLPHISVLILLELDFGSSKWLRGTSGKKWRMSTPTSERVTQFWVILTRLTWIYSLVDGSQKSTLWLYPRGKQITKEYHVVSFPIATMFLKKMKQFVKIHLSYSMYQLLCRTKHGNINKTLIVNCDFVLVYQYKQCF